MELKYWFDLVVIDYHQLKFKKFQAYKFRAQIDSQ